MFGPSKRLLALCAVPVGLVLTWLALATTLPVFVLPTPDIVFLRMVTDRGVILSDAFVTLVEALLGLGLGAAIAFLAALLFQAYSFGRTAIMPWAVVLKSIPIVAIAPLLVLWIGNGLGSKIILVSLVCFFPLLVALDDGLCNLPKGIADLCTVTGARASRTLLLVKIPYALVQFFSGLKVAAPLAVVGAIVSEYSGATAGLGHRILLSAYRADASGLIANTIVCSVVGYFVYMLAFTLSDWLLNKFRANINVA